MCDFIVHRISQEGELLRIGCDVGKESKQVLCVQFATIEGACDIDSTLNVVGENRRVDCLSLLRNFPRSAYAE